MIREAPLPRKLVHVLRELKNERREFERILGAARIPKDQRSDFRRAGNLIFQNLARRVFHYGLLGDVTKLKQEVSVYSPLIAALAIHSSDPLAYLNFMGKIGPGLPETMASLRPIAYPKTMVLNPIDGPTRERRDRIFDALSAGSKREEKIAAVMKSLSANEDALPGGLAIGLLTEKKPAGIFKVVTETDHANETAYLLYRQVNLFLLKYGIYLLRGQNGTSFSPLAVDYSFSEALLRIYIINKGTTFPDSDCSGLCIGTDILMYDISGSTLGHELQHAFSAMIHLDLSPQEHEYPAMLGQIDQIDNPTLASVAIQLGMRNYEFDHGTFTGAKADYFRGVRAALGDFDSALGKGIISGDVITYGAELPRKIIRDLINRFYEQRCGLSYEAILEPFLRG